MNIVQVNLYEDPTKKRYTYKVPAGICLKRGYIVKVKNTNGRELPAVCVSDSEDVNDNVISMIMNGNKPVSSVMGLFSYIDFDLVEAMSNKINP